MLDNRLANCSSAFAFCGEHFYVPGRRKKARANAPFDVAICDSACSLRVFQGGDCISQLVLKPLHSKLQEKNSSLKQ
jgi:hypothetical protein